MMQRSTKLRVITVTLALVAGGLASLGVVTQTPPVSASSDPFILAAGDIACDPTNSSFNGGAGSSSNCREMYTSDLLVGSGAAAVLPLGDNQYYCGGYQAFLQSYDPSWGRVKAITHPAVGNHEYLTSGGTGCDSSNAGAAGYFKYFGAAAGDPSKGYYSYDIGTWHLIVLNSQCGAAGGCGATSPQGVWLRNDLAAHTNFCTMAYWHIPLFSSGGRASSTYKVFWDPLYAANADVVLSSHDHLYERFAPQTPSGTADPVRGIREFVVGSGGANHTSFTSTIFPNSEVRDDKTYGVLKMTLHPTSYDWQFIPEAGKTFTDSGSTACHGSTSTADTTPPSTPTGLTASAASGAVNLSWTASTDNVGVSGYQIWRNGVHIADTSGTGTTYTDSTVAPLTSYSYTVAATDSAGNVSAQSAPATVTTGSGPSTLTFTPVADSYVQSDTATTNYGTAARVVADASPLRRGLLKFTVSGLSAAPKSAVLRLSCVDGSSVGGVFHRVADTTWTETGVTWNNQPPADSATLGSLGSVSAGTTYSVDVTSLVKGNGTYSIEFDSGSTNGAYYSSREGATPPQLVVTP
ncbi:MAG: CBM96 family carbohydrate-binding protein [Actinomycetes bacterium]